MHIRHSKTVGFQTIMLKHPIKKKNKQQQPHNTHTKKNPTATEIDSLKKSTIKLGDLYTYAKKVGRLWKSTMGVGI